MTKKLDLTGKRFTRWEVIKPCDSNKVGATWLCKCDCGNEKVVATEYLRAGHSKSCGCLQKEICSTKSWKGCGELSGTYWSQLKCKASLRGIQVTTTIEDLWQLFLKQEGKCSLTGKPICLARDARQRKNKQTASLDRIDSSKGYVKGNLQWVHKTIQMMKNILSQEEFMDWCDSVSKHRRKK